MERSSRKGPSQRQLRVGEQMRHVIAEMLQRGGLHDLRLDDAHIIVSEVRVSPDLKHATVFTAELGKPLQDNTREILNRYGPVLGGKLAKVMRLKYAPKVQFVADESFSEAAHIDELIARERDALLRGSKPGGNGDE